MRTFPVLTEQGATVAFEVENVLLPPRTIGTVLQSVPGVTSLSVRRPFSSDSTWLVKFEFRGRRFLVVEPFGDNSRYWIGPENTNEGGDIEALQAAIRNYKAPAWRRLLGALVG
jgi:hypothetical protein